MSKATSRLRNQRARRAIRNLALLFAAIAMTAAPTFAQAQSESESRTLTVDDAFEIAGVSTPRVSPEGDLVAYVVSTTDLEENKGSSRIWTVPLAGGDPYPMTAAASSASSPRWSPDGRYLGFLAARGEDASQVWLLDRRGGEARALTEVRQGVSSFEWSPDSSRLLLTIRDASPEREDGEPRPPWVVDRLQFKRDYTGYLDRRRNHLYVFEIDGADLRQLTSGDFDHSGAVWKPDGSAIAFASNRTEEPDGNYDTDVWTLDVDAPDAEPVRVSTSTGADDSPTWSADGVQLAWLTSLRPEVGGYAMRHVAVARPGEEPSVISEAVDRNIYSLSFAPGDDAIIGVLESEGAQHLVSFALPGGAMTTVWGGQRRVQQFDVASSGNVVATSTQAGVPTEIYAVLENGKARQLTDHNGELFAQLELGKVRSERFTGPDGTLLHSLFTFPPGAQEGDRHPAILWIHGGPQGQDDWGFDFTRQLYAAHGYVVIQANYRGSHGFGQEFALGLWQDWGGPERIDVIAAVDHAIERGWVDPERLGVGGWSYGGITTNAVITHTGRFKAAISGAGSALFVANYGHDQYQRWYEQELGLPWENRELWERLSTFNRVQHITTPTLWIGGEKDWNVPIHDSELMYQSMKRLGRETLLVVYPDQHHGGFPPKYQRDRYHRFLGWFGKYLQGDDSMWPRP